MSKLPIHSHKFIAKYMRLAGFIASDNDACPSRQVGAVIIDSNHNTRGTGYNGPPAGTPHCNSIDYLTNVIEPALTADQKESLLLTYGSLSRAWSNCYGCPRKFLGFESGERTELCSCQHAEANAIYNAISDVSGCAMYATLAPCVGCAGAIINARIREIHYPAKAVYHPQAFYLLEHSQVELYPYTDA